MTDIIEVHQLRKAFPSRNGPVDAVRGLDLRIAEGELFGLLGPNGAGKTTTLRMLTTLLEIDAGRAVVAGADVARDARTVRRRIGYVGQAGGADLPATGRENLLLQGRLYRLSRADAARRAEELIDALALGGFVDRRARTYSGGQRRRLEIALGLMHRPRVLFLDEPTTGLDPQNRANLWEQLRSLRAAGTTIVLTTHYLEEADALADRLAAGPTRSYAGTKRQLNAWLYSRMHEQLELEASIQQEMAASGDFAEGVTAFVEKRPARFAGR
jgi:ABC-2 type transport system ATP-binding protein